MFQLKRNESNPILRPHPDLAWEKEGVFNPGIAQRLVTSANDSASGATEREVVMLYRAVGERESYISHIGLATSKDGVHFERYIKPHDARSAGIIGVEGAPAIQPEPVFGPSKEYDKWATEDFRITPIGNDFYITYVAVPDRIMDNGKSVTRILPLETSTALLRTRDFLNFDALGIISPPSSDNKDIVIFPKKIKTKIADGTEKEKYYMLHRPNRWSKDWFAGEYAKAVNVPLPACAPNPEDLPTLPSIWIASSDDLIHWDDHHLLLSPSHATDAKIGPGMPPIETPEGWLMIYHHVDQLENPKRFRYSIRVALLDLNDPTKIIGKLPYDILAPTEPCEKENGTQIVFPTGGFVSGDELSVYYGASDFSICLATGSVSELLAELKKEGIGGKTRHETA